MDRNENTRSGFIDFRQEYVGYLYVEKILWNDNIHIYLKVLNNEHSAGSSISTTMSG